MPDGLPEGFTPDRPETAKPVAAPTSSGAGSKLPAGFAVDKPAEQPTGDVDFGTQTLYDMAMTPTERKRALEHGYGAGNVKEDASGLYVEKDGKRLKPAQSAFKGPKAMTARILAETAPTLGAIGGGLLSAPGVVTSVAGAALGGAAGQAFNDAILGLAGIHDRKLGEEMKDTATAGMSTAAGEGAGRMIGHAAGAALHEGGSMRKMARWALGVDEAELSRAKELADAGINTPPESYAKESTMLPIIRKWAQRFGYDPVAKTAKPYYEHSAGKVLEQLGIPKDEVGDLTSPKSAVSYEKTGEALIKKAQQRLAEDDAKLDSAVNTMRSSMTRKMTDAAEAHTAQVENLTRASTDARESAQKIIDHGWSEIDKTQEKMWKAAKLGEEPGNLARTYAGQVWNMRKAVMRRARSLYDAADSAAGGRVIDVSRMSGTAKALVDQLPEELQRFFPGVVRTLSEMENTGLTFGEARNLRSQLREMANFDDLQSSIKNGALKKLSGELNGAIHAPGNQPKIKAAVDLLDKADDFYASQMGRFKDQEVRSLVNQVKSGLPADPEVIAKKVLKGGNAERAAELKRIVGPEVWKATVAADINGMFDQSKSLIPGQYDTAAFADQVLSRLRSGVLDSYPSQTRRLLEDHARRLAAMDGTLKVPKLPNEDFTTFLSRAEEMENKVKELAKIDPIEGLQSELKRYEQEFKAQRSQVEQGRAADQLAFLTKPGALATESAKRIVRSPDLLRSALLRFDADGPEIKMLRQTAARDMLTMGLEHGGNLMDRLTAEGMTPEVQKRLFPDGLDQDVLKLAENMAMLFPKGSDSYAALSGGALATNPARLAPGVVKKALGGVANVALRIPVSKALSVVANIITSPALVKALAKGISEGPEEREAVKKAVQSVAESGGDIGTVLGSWVGQGALSTHDPVDASAGGDRGSSWRDRYQSRYARAK